MISILMPVKNPGKYLEPCIESIIEQEYVNWELIAVNDNSEDDSRNYLDLCAAKDRRVKVYENNGSGIIDALRTAYSKCSGDCIHRMDADDIMPLGKLSEMKNMLQKGAVVTGYVKYFSSDWMVGLGFQNYECWLNKQMEKGAIWNDIYMECPIPSPAWLINRVDFEKIGGFNSERLPEDYDLCFRMYKHNIEVRFVPQIVHLWRDSQTRISRKDPQYFPMAYYPLKVYYFLQIDRDRTKQLTLWGAGKKGKKIAQILLDNGDDFVWVTDNTKKIGVEIYGKKIEAITENTLAGNQIIIAVASPDDKQIINLKLNELKLIKALDYWWFC